MALLSPALCGAENSIAFSTPKPGDTFSPPTSIPSPLESTPVATLYVLLIGDTNDENIGRSVQVDLTNLTKLIKSIEEHTGLTVRPQTFQGDALGAKQNSYDQIKQAIQTLNVVPQRDVVIFYYSGHGGRKHDKESKWPLLGVEGDVTRLDKMLDLDWVIATLQQKQPRLWIAIADTCNSVVDQMFSSRSPTPRLTKNPDHYKKLFLDYQGHIIASSSKFGQYSYGGNEKGGLYTYAWLNSINQELSTATTNPNWEDLMHRADDPIKLSRPTSIQQPQSVVQVTPVPPPSPRPITSPIGPCSQNQYGPDPKDPTKECCMSDDGKPVCAKK